MGCHTLNCEKGMTALNKILIAHHIIQLRGYQSHSATLYTLFGQPSWFLYNCANCGHNQTQRIFQKQVFENGAKGTQFDFQLCIYLFMKKVKK